ncbi:putative membrane protein [Cellulophaga baltica]|uniref:Putative membrane protein n=2 Tax=Cellulophaga baltica TaxID=76594 RepID=A0A1G7ICX6_9FLAO|nr:putative membrane protein [Cellulophaga baltica]
MGAADVVPGVSGGTIAFISGIYEELIDSINNVDISLFKTLKTLGIKSFWKQLNGNFLVALFLGIGISVLSLAKGISWLLLNQPVLLWSFFFGLVVASILFVGKSVEKWNLATIVMLVIGTGMAYYITTLPPAENTDSLPFLFLSGALAICAMILPGISGAFILVLLGSYKVILDAVHEYDLKIVATVGLGAIFGLLSFARLLKWMFKHYKDITLAVLTGFILGSLNKIWPWKKILETKVFGDKIITVSEESVSPFSYEGDHQLMFAIILALVGFSLILLLEKLASKK